jgi:RHH-type proline utilization regulon transcriptional repressor/proline dehydrogenase/delta 1-pyrroline-5-carboxylate dehydrogenase
MNVPTGIDESIRDLEAQFRRAVDAHPPLVLTPAWFQQHLLDWATSDPDFRVKLLRFVDVLPTLRTPQSVADHVRQYFRGTRAPFIEAASGLASARPFRPILSQIVRSGVFSMADRFIAGATPEEALPRLRELAKDGVGYTVDLLGEATLSDTEADAYRDRYVALIEALAAAESEHINVSIKLSALCPHLEPAAPAWVSAASAPRLRDILRAAMNHGAFINFDMEQYRYRELVLTAFQDALLEPEFAAYPHFGIVVQAYLRDAEQQISDLASFAKRRGTPVAVRLVKGAYWDEEHIIAEQNGWPVPVYTDKQETDASYDRCTDLLLDTWTHLRPAFGSHNPYSVAQAAVKARARGIADRDIEFQMLYGMAEGLRRQVAEMGWPTRVYMPLGQVIPGMAYLVRRLLENTSNQAWFNSGASGRDGVTSHESLLPGAVAETGGETARTASGTTHFRNSPPAAFFLPESRGQMHEAIKRRRQSFGAKYPILIGEEAIADRETARVTYPDEPETVLGFVAQATSSDAAAAVAAAVSALPAWRDMPAAARTEVLRHAADLLEAERFHLAALMVFESGKPWHEADGDVSEAADYLRYYGAQAEALGAPRQVSQIAGEHNEYFHSGRGVAAIIAPWNFPLAIICGMSAGALAGGNCAILKPAGQSPIIAHELVRILRAAGVPPGVVQYLPGPGSQVGQALVEHPDVDIIAFTGSSEVGLRMIETAAKTRPGQRSVKRVTAEMGGKNAIIIDDDADLDQAVAGVISSAFGYAGQKCSACSRLIILDSAYEEAIERLARAVESLVVGPPHLPETFVPPVIDAAAKTKIEGYITGAGDYARLLVRGSAPGGDGHYVRPTVFTDVPADSPLAQEEVFGPVLAVFRARTFEDALAIAENSRFGLTGGIFSRNPRHIELARRQFQVGSLYINRPVTGAIPGRHPFGGMRMSGIGEKAGGPDYVRQFMEPRTISENTTRRGFAPDEPPTGV